VVVGSSLIECERLGGGAIAIYYEQYQQEDGGEAMIPSVRSKSGHANSHCRKNCATIEGLQEVYPQPLSQFVSGNADPLHI
jgi:hypothetical protein